MYPRLSFFHPLLFLLVSVADAATLTKLADSGTSSVSDLARDTRGRWYAVRDGELVRCAALLTDCVTMEGPWGPWLLPGLLTVDNFDSAYVQAANLKVYVVAPNGVFEELVMPARARLVGRPLAWGKQMVLFCSEQALMSLEAGDTNLVPLPNVPPFARKHLTSLSVMDIRGTYGDIYYHSGGGPRYWLYYYENFSYTPLLQLDAPVRRMGRSLMHVFFVVKGEQAVRVVLNAANLMNKKPAVIEQLDANLVADDQTDFVAWDAERTYVYGGINDRAVIYQVDSDVKNITGVTKLLERDGLRLLCSVLVDGKVHFGTSDGIYRLDV